MTDKDLKKYKSLNEIAEKGGIVIFGGSDDKNIPLCELKQAFSLNSDVYNRSVTNLSVNNALEIYSKCIAELYPETVLLHIGDADLKLYKDNPSDFEQKYCNLINRIKTDNKKCDVAVVSLKNYKNNADITMLNKSLKNIADSEHCDYCDVSAKRVWNPKQTKDIISFVYDIGFVRPLRKKRPVSDMVRTLFCWE